MAKRFVRDDASVKESVLNLITNIDPVENYLVSNLQNVSGNDEFHFIPKDTLRTPGLRAAIEGADPTYDGNNPTKDMNVMQIVEVGFEVTDSEGAVDRYGSPEDRVAYETDKALSDWAKFAEFALLRSTVITGNNSTARQMDGLKECLTHTSAQSGVSFTETILNNYFQAAWDDGVNIDTVLAPMYMKRKISGFNAEGATKYYNQEDKRLVLPIEVYESDASNKPVKLIAHRYVQQSGDTNYDVVGIEQDHFAVAYLRQPNTRTLAKTGDSEKRQVIGELTLECRSEKAGFVASAHL